MTRLWVSFPPAEEDESGKLSLGWLDVWRFFSMDPMRSKDFSELWTMEKGL